jgi:hypothetical protein
LIIQITFGEAHRSCNFTLCNLLQSSVTSSLLGPYSPQHLLSYILSLCSSLNVRPSVIPIQNNIQNYSSVCLNLHNFQGKVEDKRFCTEWYKIADIPCLESADSSRNTCNI